jgi:hypothetical protein
MMQTRWLFRVTYIYLLVPFMLFCLGWLRLAIALAIIAFMLWIFWRLWNNAASIEGLISARITVSAVALTGLWIFLSGVGGYAFQNWDHHWRNAVLHDLITYHWPVIYSTPDRGPIKMLIYYVGYWLPSALVGKVFGWKAANFFLFLWTWLGVFLVTLHLSCKLRASLFKTALLLILFSGMDALGVLILPGKYPTLWPPIQHLEIWNGVLQYSSFTTQLFWVFNQAVPAWLCISMLLSLSEAGRHQHADKDSSDKTFWIVQRDSIGQMLFVWTLCFFFAPLASVGLLPYLLIEWFKQTDIKNPFKGVRFDLLLAGTVIVLVSYLFFSSNTAAQERGFLFISLKDFLAFFLLEGGILLFLLAPFKWRDPRWAATGALLICIPFVQLGSGSDFVMRASIAPLFYLMVMTGEVLFQRISNRFYQIAIIGLLLIGALTPLYEINRSVYKTFVYYFNPDQDRAGSSASSSSPVTHLEQGIAPELDHPGVLVADEIRTLAFMQDKLSENFIANVRQSLYYRYLSRH